MRWLGSSWPGARQCYSMTARRPTAREISSWAPGGGWALCIAKLRFGSIAGVIRPGSDAICCVPCDEPGVKSSSPYSVIDVSWLHCNISHKTSRNDADGPRQARRMVRALAAHGSDQPFGISKAVTSKAPRCHRARVSGPMIRSASNIDHRSFCNNPLRASRNSQPLARIVD